jgi:hypothetical protein
VFLVGRTTPGYGAERIADTLIGATVAVIAVLLSPSAPGPGAVMSRALAPLRRCSEILHAVSTGIGSQWTPVEAESWRGDAMALIGTIAAARRDHEGHRQSTRWNARAHRRPSRRVPGLADQRRPGLELVTERSLTSFRVLRLCTQDRVTNPANG